MGFLLFLLALAAVGLVALWVLRLRWHSASFRDAFLEAAARWAPPRVLTAERLFRQMKRAITKVVLTLPSGRRRAPDAIMVRISPNDFVRLADDYGWEASSAPGQLSQSGDSRLADDSVGGEADSAALEAGLDLTDSSPTRRQHALDLRVDDGRLVTLFDGDVIGRDRTCSLKLDSTGVSRRHARVTWSRTGWLVEDLHSSNGTYVNEAGLPGQVPAALQRGDRIRLGRGGFGSVWKARDSVEHRSVAVKVIHPDSAAIAFTRGLFMREVRTLASLKHASVVSIYDYGQGEVYYNDQHRYQAFFIVTEFVEGLNLARLASSAVGINEAVAITQQVLTALDHVHAQGILHRDIKPENIMVAADGSIKVIDFGIAKILNATSSGIMAANLGTWAYASPEQIGRDANIDARTDLYSTGCVLYELLTGQAPFSGPDHSATPESPHGLNPNVPVPLSNVVMKALAYDRVDRYQSAGRFLSALTDAANRRTLLPGETRNHSEQPYQSGKETRRSLRAALALVLVVGAIIGITRIVPVLGGSHGGDALKQVGQQLQTDKDNAPGPEAPVNQTYGDDVLGPKAPLSQAQAASFSRSFPRLAFRTVPRQRWSAWPLSAGS